MQSHLFAFNNSKPSDDDIDLALRFWRGFPPQKNSPSSAPLWDPCDESNPDRIELYSDGIREPIPIDAGTVHLFCTESSTSRNARDTVKRILALEPAMIDRLAVSFQPYTIRVQASREDASWWPAGFPADGIQKTDAATAEAHANAWLDSGRVFQRWRSIEWIETDLCRSVIPGWASVDSMSVSPYTIQPDLRSVEVRAWLVSQIVAQADRAGVRGVYLAMKTNWFRNAAPALSTPENPVLGPWLPSLYTGDSYLAATSTLTQDLLDAGLWVCYRDSSSIALSDILPWMPDGAVGCSTVWSPSHLRDRGFDEVY